MPQSERASPTHRAALLMTGVLTGVAAFQTLLVFPGAVMLLMGLALRRHPGRRSIGNSLCLVGAASIAAALIFAAGYRVGTDLADLDRLQQAAFSFDSSHEG